MTTTIIFTDLNRGYSWEVEMPSDEVSAEAYASKIVRMGARNDQALAYAVKPVTTETKGNIAMSVPALEIPTVARGAVRAFIKGQSGFDAWQAAKGIAASRDVRNAHLVEYAEEHGLLEEVKDIIARANAPQPAQPSQSLQDMLDERDLASEGIFDVVPAALPNPPAEIVVPEAQIEGRKPRSATQSPVESETEVQSPMTQQFDASSLLSPVEPFLSPLVRGELEKALAPVIAAANKPAVVKTITKTVTVEAQPLAPVGQAPYAVKTDLTSEFGKLFGLKGQSEYLKSHVTLWNSCGASPAVDPYYVVDAENMGALALGAEAGLNVWQVGPAGSGKTTQPEQFAAHTGRPFVKITFSRQTEIADLVGGYEVKDGATQWKDGALIAAMKRPGTVILFDEPTLAPAGVQAIIQAVTDEHRTFTIQATGEVVRAAHGIVFVVADNTNGSGDDTGQYAGTNQANAALVNRFKAMVRVDYLSKSQETKALRNHTGAPTPACEHVVDFFHKARKLPELETVVLSLRQMTGLVKLVAAGFPSKVALRMALLERLPNTERAALETLATLDWGSQFEALMKGQALSPAIAPSDGNASRAFDDEISASLSR
jgi:MoxR-like ATPase